MGPDTPRHDTSDRDNSYTLTIEDVAHRYSAANHPRTIRTLQRYCANGHLDCLKAPTKLGDMFLVTPESVARHLAELDEIAATTRFATGRDEPRPADQRDAAGEQDSGALEGRPTDRDLPRQPAAADTTSARYVERLEGEVEFLRDQVTTKDAQIKELTERSRETNHLIAGLQKMLTPLLGTPGHQSSAFEQERDKQHRG